MNTIHFLNLAANNIFNIDRTTPLPDTYYLGLSTTAPNLDGTGFTEPTNESYTRILLTSLSAPVEGVIKNTKNLQFQRATEEWGLVTHWLVFDSITGGKLLQYGKMADPVLVQKNSVFLYEAEKCEFSVLNPTELEII